MRTDIDSAFSSGAFGRQPLRRGGDRLALRGDDRKVPRAVHHQKSNQPAALIDHRERDLATESLGLGDASGDHFQARFMREPASGNKIGHWNSLSMNCCANLRHLEVMTQHK
jgi:hypothetical protein